MIQPKQRTAGAGAGVHQGVITRVDGGDVYLEIPRLSPGLEYGPVLACEVPTPWAAGQQVLCAFLEGRRDEPAVVCRLG